jgi:predicted acylesterase/phospholipase RssA
MPMVRIGEDYFWDGGMVSNTPLQHLLDHVREDILVFQVDLFSARGPIPRAMFEVQARTKEIQYSPRTRLTTDHYMQLHRQRVCMRRLLAKVPGEMLNAEERALWDELACLPRINILHLIYQEATYRGRPGASSSRPLPWRNIGEPACATPTRRCRIATGSPCRTMIPGSSCMTRTGQTARARHVRRNVSQHSLRLSR